jgi:hypothetical protein
MRTELACARALSDALEIILDADRGDVIVQLADQLVRVASTMRQWEATHHPHGIIDTTMSRAS